MKAAVYKAAGTPLVIEDIAEPEPGPNDLILRVKACGICGTDLHWSESTDASGGWRVLEPNTVMGHEFSGEVVEIGRDLRGQWKIGDRACALPSISCNHCDECRAGRFHRCAQVTMRTTPVLSGAYAEYTRIGAAQTLSLSDAVGYREAALVEPLAVGLHAVKKAQISAGDSVLIVGAGPVGLAVALWCRFFGAHHIIVSDLVSERAERAIDFGATAAIDASREDVSSCIAQMSGGAPQIVFDCVGVPGSLQIAIDYASYDARVVVVGLCMSADNIFPAKALIKEVNLLFSFVYDKRDFEIVVDLLNRERIDVSGLITDCVGFDKFSQTFEALKTPNQQIKVMLEP